MQYSLGIDLGTTFSTVATVDETGCPKILQNSQGKTLTPSVIYFGKKESVVGDEAKEMQAFGEAEVASFFKRNMGDPNFILDFNGKDYTPQDLSGIVLSKLKADAEIALGSSVAEAVITVPAYFNNFQREATIKAGEIAGLKVLRIINEPTAAAIAYGIKTNSNDQKILVYDLGGGTFDVTLVCITKNKVEVLATDGDHELGGKNWDDRIAAYLAQRFRDDYEINPLEDSISFNDLLIRCEEAKKQLSIRDKAKISISHKGEKAAYQLTRSMFEEMTKDLMERTQYLTEQVLYEAGIGDWKELEGVLLVGGSTRMPMVWDYVEKMSGKKPMAGVNVDEAVALGAAIQASIDAAEFSNISYTLAGKKETHDVMSHSLGVVSENADRSKYINSIIIPKNKTIPCIESRPFQLHTLRDTDNQLEVYMLQGESDIPSQCVILGKYVFSNITHEKTGIAIIDIEYAYDRNGVVTVSAKERYTNKKLPMKIEPVPDDMSWLELPPPEEEVVSIHISVILVIDVSVSMEGSPIIEAKNAAKEFIKKSDLAHTSVGLVDFGSQANKIINPSQNAGKINRAINSLTIHGSTNMRDGINIAHSMLKGLDDPRFIVVLTDGQPDDSKGAIRAADNTKASGIDIITIGTGGADRIFLKKLASSDESSIFAQAGSVVATFSKIAQVLAESGGGMQKSANCRKKKKVGFLKIFK